jgi:hypothetical protein
MGTVQERRGKEMQLKEAVTRRLVKTMTEDTNIYVTVIYKV